MNEFNKLKKVIIGSELQTSLNMLENNILNELKSFNYFFKSDFDKNDIRELINNMNIKIKDRQNSISNFIKTIKKEKIDVYNIEDSDLYVSSNPRDIFSILDDVVLVTNSLLKYRRREFDVYIKNFPELFRDKKILDLREIFKKYEILEYDYTHYNLLSLNKLSKNYEKYRPNFEAANILKCGDKIIMNVSNKSEYHAYILLEKLLGVEITPIFIDYHHIDGALNIINNEICLLCFDSNIVSKNSILNHLPEFIKNMDIIFVDKNPKSHEKIKYKVLASIGGMFINSLSIDENTVIVNKEALYVIDELERRGIKVLKLNSKNSELFGGGFHCMSVDVERYKDGK